MQKKKLSIFELFIAIYYTWFFMPIVNAYFSGGIFKFVFFAFFAVGMIGLLFLEGKIYNVSINRLIVVVLAYFAIMTFFYFADIKDASEHIRVSFTFWGTILLYLCALDDGGKIRLGKFFIVLFLATCLTSSIGVIIDNEAARAITHAATDDPIERTLKMKNIAGIYLFQCMVLCVPSLIALSKNIKMKVLNALILVFLTVVLINASFTISILLFFVTLVLTFALTEAKTKNRKVLKILICVLLLSLLFSGESLLDWFASTINNPRVSERILGISELLYGTGEAVGDVSSRIDVYKLSFKTFCREFPFGAGPHYSYVSGENGMGYHSQFIDDIARYGVFAILFYVFFLTGYYKLLKQSWQEYDKSGNSKVPLLTTLIYFMFLIFNLGFRSGTESVVMLFIIPVLPKLCVEIENKRVKRREVESL
jgi:hypothetical protein